MQAASSPVRKKTKKRQSSRLRQGHSANDTLKQLQRWNASMQSAPGSPVIAPLESPAREVESTDEMAQQEARDLMLAYARQASCIHKCMVNVTAVLWCQAIAQSFTSGQHEEGTKALLKDIVALNPETTWQKILRGRDFDERGQLVEWRIRWLHILYVLNGMPIVLNSMYICAER